MYYLKSFIKSTRLYAIVFCILFFTIFFTSITYYFNEVKANTVRNVQIPGDANLDGYINSVDASLILKFASEQAAGKNPTSINGDFNCDGKINSIDASSVLRFSAKEYMQLGNAIYFPGIPRCISPINIKKLPATQYNVDRFDIVEDTSNLCKAKNAKFLYGHDYGSFKYLDKLQVGQQIIYWENSIPYMYTVITNEIGQASYCDILDENGKTLLLTEFDENTLRLVTCSSITDPLERRVVIAVQNSGAF